MKLADDGFGDINTIRNLEVDKFFNLLHYSNYKTQYLEYFRLLNQKKK